MTVVIAAKGNGFIVVGSDTRGTIRNRLVEDRIDSDNERKIFPISKHVIIAVAGNGDVGTQLVEKFRSTLKRNEDGVTIIVEKFAKFCKKEIYGENPAPDQRLPDISFIVTGLDKRRKGYVLPLIYTLDCQTGFALGRKENEAIDGRYFIPAYVFKKEFKSGSDVTTLSKLVAKSIYETSKFDSNVNDAIKIYIIDKDCWREMLGDDVSELYSRW